ncbi:PQQ-binding-like beta-propeller repeat protein [Pelagibacteraceae bacterium]|nr:PQQ-binding-like beta-propeller repeat protein [Pelagibacteraceae bacterium]
MKRFFLIFIILILSSCSLDNKTGIWKDASNTPIENQQIETIDNDYSSSRYENVYEKKQTFNEEKKPINSNIFKLDKFSKKKNWLQEYGDNTNNVSNYSYDSQKILISKSPRLSKIFASSNVIFFDDNLIMHDHNGKIFIYSLSLRKKIFTYDFYKKNFKNINKKINLILDKNILYAADNLGYLYAINLDAKSLIWAKNYGIPFRSNLKIINEQILLINQDNVLYSFNKDDGVKNWEFATTTTFLKTNFKNSIALDEITKNLFFLNTSGELYSINYSSKKINWVLNFKNSSLAGDTDLFLSQPIILKNNNIIITTENNTLNIDILSGKKNWNFPSGSVLKPILTNNYTYIFSKNNLLICIENKTGNVLWSKNISTKLYKEKINKKIGEFYDFKLANNEIIIFTKNGYLLSFNYKNGNLDYSQKISKKGINSKVFFSKEHMFLIDNNNKLLKFN